MQAVVMMNQEEEPPSVLWGLDPMFSAFPRLYIKDILQIRESCQVPGVYFYNSHPILKVDVLGTVVYKRERDDFFSYGVDDGTGVINCMCWKNEKWRDSGHPVECKTSEETQTGFNPVAELKRLRQTQQGCSQLEIGETLRVRGPVKTFRQQREIRASTFYKVNDPVMAVQIAWMMEVPHLYRQCYDKPFQLQAKVAGGPTVDRLTTAANVIKNFLKEKTVTKFRPYDVLDLLEPLVSGQCQAKSTEQAAAASRSGARQVHQLLKETLQVLQDEGTVFRKVKSQDEVYHVTDQDTQLLIAVKNVISVDSRREKYADKGCHILHILSAVRQQYCPNVSKVALELVLKSLECNSEIISTSNCHYTMFS